MSHVVVDECLRAFAAGRAVVLVAPDADRWGAVVGDLSDHGRIALLVGNLPADAEAAEAMAGELFADRDVVVVDGSITEGPSAPTA